MDFSDRPLAVTDIETTGLDPKIHEIIEVAVLLVNQRTFKTLDEFDSRIYPTSLKRANKMALKVTGYNERDWTYASELKEAMEVYSQKTRNAIYTDHKPFFSYSFITEAFIETRVEDLMYFYHLDLFTLAWSKRKKMRGLKKFHLSDLRRYFNILEERKPFRAIHGARIKLDILKRLSKI